MFPHKITHHQLLMYFLFLLNSLHGHLLLLSIALCYLSSRTETPLEIHIAICFHLAVWLHI